MNLIIRKNNNNNVYELEGRLAKLNVHLFKNEFQNIFDKKSHLTISIVDLDIIDDYGVNAIAKLNDEANSKQKTFSIIGVGNQKLFNHFKAVETLEIKNKSSENVTETNFKVLSNFFQNYKKMRLPSVNTTHI